jgi:hypothetical protein
MATQSQSICWLPEPLFHKINKIPRVSIKLACFLKDLKLTHKRQAIVSDLCGLFQLLDTDPANSAYHPNSDILPMLKHTNMLYYQRTSTDFIFAGSVTPVTIIITVIINKMILTIIYYLSIGYCKRRQINNKV